jgi:NAD(P)-dependent dehydrogenase (short-subunit alcohol dehydrogenase family)
VPRKLRDAVVVVTGASSGICRATALAFAREGSSVVVTARRTDELTSVVQACEQLGGRATGVPADVTDAEAVSAVARTASETYGRIGVWVDNAGVTAFGRFEETPPDVFRRVIDTNLLDYVNRTRAVLPFFREQGAVELIDVASMVGDAASPYLRAYSTSRAAILAFAESLRMEVRDAPGIHVCSVLPASIDTPLFQHAVNDMGRAPKALNPVYDAKLVPGAIVTLAQHSQRELAVGNAGRMLMFTHRFAPALYERMAPKQVEVDHFQDRPAEPTSGNLFEPMPQWSSVRGGGGDKRVAALGLGVAGAVASWFVFRPRVPHLLRR